jgi:hypothetical protein
MFIGWAVWDRVSPLMRNEKFFDEFEHSPVWSGAEITPATNRTGIETSLHVFVNKYELIDIRSIRRI